MEEKIITNRNPELKVKDINKILNKLDINDINKINNLLISKNNINKNKLFIGGVSKDINKRLYYYNILYNIIRKINETKIVPINCLKYYNKDNIAYKIVDEIILENRIGSKSVFGTIFLSYYKNIKKYKFATKITDYTYEANLEEYNILSRLTKYVIEKKTPHFPICYGKILCFNYDNKFYDKLIITFNELANGDLKMFYIKYYNNDEIMLNAFAQIYISLMSFYYYMKSFHNDAHYGNFLYHKIRPGGYFHYNIYNKDYYLKNIGYLWIIWDFGLVSPFKNNNNISIIRDYRRVINTFINDSSILTKISNFLNNYTDNIIYKYTHLFIGYGWASSKYKYSDNFNNIISCFLDILENTKYIKDINLLPILNTYLIDLMVEHNLILTSINPNEKIINDKPYIIK
jgi:hypothetical protein